MCIRDRVITISEKSQDYAEKITSELENAGIRVETDFRAEKIGYKIREARNERVPYMLVVGEKDREANLVSLRRRDSEDVEQISLSNFLSMIQEEIKERR